MQHLSSSSVCFLRDDLVRLPELPVTINGLGMQDVGIGLYGLGTAVFDSSGLRAT